MNWLHLVAGYMSPTLVVKGLAAREVSAVPRTNLVLGYLRRTHA